jgi:hypothetical protein
MGGNGLAKARLTGNVPAIIETKSKAAIVNAPVIRAIFLSLTLIFEYKKPFLSRKFDQNEPLVGQGNLTNVLLLPSAFWLVK